MPSKLTSTNCDFTWVILAGGRGTRSANPSLPKILQVVDKKTVLEHLIESLGLESKPQQELIFILRFKSNQVREAVLHLAKSMPNLKFRFIEDQGAGPVAALKCAIGEIRSSNFGCILGDTLIKAPMQFMASRFMDSGKSFGVTVRQTNHLADSDKVALDWSNSIVEVFPKGSEANTRSGLIFGLTGLVFMQTSKLAKLSPNIPDLPNAVLSASEANDVQVIKTIDYFRDTGTPERLAQCRRDLEFGGQNKEYFDRKAHSVFMDRDGTLLPDVPRGRRDFEVNEFNPVALSLIKQTSKQHLPLFLVTNQPAIAKGFINFSDVYYVHNKIQTSLIAQIGTHFDDIVFCPHHPEKGHNGERPELKIECLCRKPNVGLVTRLAEDYNLAPSIQSTVVGDSKIDFELAEKLGCKFIDINWVN